MYILIIGFDAFDPTRFERLSNEGRLPNLTKYADAGNYARLTVSNPPQTEVSWTSIATGLNPGGHGIFDFVHRDPSTYTPYVSLLPTKRGLGGTQFVPPHNARTFFADAADQGYPATALWWPATFPARPELPVRTLPGLGTPDLLGRLGVGTLFTTEQGRDGAGMKTAVAVLTSVGSGRWTATLEGPVRKTRKGTQGSTVDLELERLDAERARLKVSKQSVEIRRGAWSPIIEIIFRMGWFARLHAVTRFLLTETEPEVYLYAIPLQIHPLHSPWRYATPGGFVKRAWRESGPFLTLGMPQDTTGLEDGCMKDVHFLALCDSILEARERVLMQQLDVFDEGVLASVFDTLDRVQHMFWRGRPDVVDAWYEKLDGLIGRIARWVEGRDAKLLVLSDHGFTDFDHKVHLNRWLLDHGYLHAGNGHGRGGLQDVNWAKSEAYAVGLNGLYVNLRGREGRGSVAKGAYDVLVARLCTELEAWTGPDGRHVVSRAQPGQDAFEGPLTVHAPDVVVGYAAGYRASSETGMGKWQAKAMEANRDHWSSDHCVEDALVPGVLFCSMGLNDLPHPTYADVPALVLGTPLDQKGPVQAVVADIEQDAAEQNAVEERLKSLGYL
jgi:predicted AlkP superfamily phosphohydrolase/phosphomutase